MTLDLRKHSRVQALCQVRGPVHGAAGQVQLQQRGGTAWAVCLHQVRELFAWVIALSTPFITKFLTSEQWSTLFLKNLIFSEMIAQTLSTLVSVRCKCSDDLNVEGGKFYLTCECDCVRCDSGLMSLHNWKLPPGLSGRCTAASN